MIVGAKDFGADEGKYIFFFDESCFNEKDGEVCENLHEVNRLVTAAFSNGAMEIKIKRWIPDIPRLVVKKESGVVMISPE